MRGRAYLRLLIAAAILTLTATTLAPDVVAPFLRYPQESSAVRAVEERIFGVLTRPPRSAAESLGIWIDSHSAQSWPSGWPVFMAFSFRLSSISLPFWFVTGVVLFEIIRGLARLARRLQKRSP